MGIAKPPLRNRFHVDADTGLYVKIVIKELKNARVIHAHLSLHNWVGRSGYGLRGQNVCQEEVNSLAQSLLFRVQRLNLSLA
jgi:hypothetical protein